MTYTLFFSILVTICMQAVQTGGRGYGQQQNNFEKVPFYFLKLNAWILVVKIT